MHLDGACLFFAFVDWTNDVLVRFILFETDIKKKTEGS